MRLRLSLFFLFTARLVRVHIWLSIFHHNMLIERDLMGREDLTFMVQFLRYRPRSVLAGASVMAALCYSRGECVLSSILIGRLIGHGL